ncbi:MAG: hypothetical protein HY294_08575 [Candidatus Rokubacteria bacterium]|nr:hypothetical protein [Candidatus Rokubacteria bacterium]MBI3826037.1 hypothetical protein [Candidatus Rokubacteria bacterium]
MRTSTDRAQRRRSRIGLVVAGVAVIAGGVAVALTELLHAPKGSVWIVVAATALVAGVIRALTAPR